MKNAITNIVGCTMVGLSIYGLLYVDLSILKFLVLNSVGGLLIYFENKSIKTFIRKALNKYLS